MIPDSPPSLPLWTELDVTAVDAATAAGARDGLIDPGLGQRVRIMARLAGGSGVSGQEIARQLGVSRMAVHKHVEALRQAGAEIVSRRGTGYRLASRWDSLAPEAVLPLLFGCGSWSAPTAAGVQGPVGEARPRSPAITGVGVPYLYQPAVGSTNEVLREAAARGAPQGAVAATDHQVGGRGRLGRRWVSEAGRDVTFSVLLRPEIPPSETSRLVVCAALAVAEVVSEVVDASSQAPGPSANGPPPVAESPPNAGPPRAETEVLTGRAARVGIKWPNDVVIERRKVCGILTEGSMDMDRLHWVVVGVGLNVNSNPRSGGAALELPAGQHPPGALSEWTGGPVPRPALLVSLLSRLWRRFGDLADGRWDGVVGGYSERDILRGSAVHVRGAAGGAPEAGGVADGIGDNGELLLRLEDGTVVAVQAGEVTLRPS